MREYTGGYRRGVRTPLENNKFYRKKQLGPITLEKVGPPDIFYPPPPPCWTLENYSFFELNIWPPLKNKFRTKKFSGFFSTSWARTAHHPSENSWIHACTHVADKHARVCTCILLYVCLYLVIIGHLMLWSR